MHFLRAHVRTVFVLAAAAVAAVAALAAPANAAGTRSAVPAWCTTGRVMSIAHNLPIYSRPDIHAEVMRWAQKGWQYNCWIGGTTTGSRYTACGVAQANGWIKLDLPWQDGYAYMTCMEDVDPG